MSGLGTSLGDLLQEAKVRGAKPVVTLKQLLIIAKPTEPEPRHPKLAMGRLPEKFRILFGITKGKEFQEALIVLLRNSGNEEVTIHTVYGLLQLAHRHRDSADLSGSRRKSFDRHVIPQLLRARRRIEHYSRRGCQPIREILLEELEK